MIEADGIERAVSLMKRFRAAQIREMVSREYPELDPDGETAETQTKKDLIDRLKDFYTES